LKEELPAILLVIMCFYVTICPQFKASVAAEPQTKILVDVLLDYGNGTWKWTSCILSKLGNDTVYNATQFAAITLNITWYGDSIFVDAIDDVWNNYPYYWIWWYWNSTESQWIMGPVACNFYVLEDCDIITWYYEDCSVWPPEPPFNPPVTQVDVLLDYGNRTIKWHENIKVTGVASVFKATKTVAVLEYSLWDSDVFVDAINGVWNNYVTNYFWLYWCWNSTSTSWDIGPVACNKCLLTNGDIIVWYYETSPWGPPSLTPHPLANFTWAPSIPKVNEPVTFDASASTPNGGTIVKYEWNFGDGSYALGKTVSHTYANPNTYTVTLNVSDSNGLWSIEQKQILVVKPYGPKAEFTATPETARAHETIRFDASSSLPGWNGTHNMPITKYHWNFGDGNTTTTTEPTTYHSYKTAGNYYVTLTVYAPGATPEEGSTTRRITVISVPVGGYSLPVKGYATERLLTLYLLSVAIVAAVFTATRRKLFRRL